MLRSLCLLGNVLTFVASLPLSFSVSGWREAYSIRGKSHLRGGAIGRKASKSGRVALAYRDVLLILRFLGT